MVEVPGRQGRGGAAAAALPKKNHSPAEETLWRCGWRCFSCTTALVACCCRCRPAPGLAHEKYPGAPPSASRSERVLLWVGVVSVLLGACLALFWPQLLTLVVHSELKLTPRSTSFRVWKSTPVPLTIDFYFWNWTNPHQIEDPAAVPHFEQMGPYRFRETKEKVNITWNANNGTISFRQLRRWYFDAANSNGTLADNVTTINVVALTAAHVVRDWYYLVRRSVALALRSTNQKISIRRTVGQFLFDGYQDPLITVASTVPGLAGIAIPNFDKFGWFYTRNGSTEYDGLFNMDTGANDIAHLGELLRWNYNNFTPYYEGECGALRGSAGELWPPGRGPRDRVSLFAPDLCRSVSLDYAGAMREAGVDGLRFEGGPLMLDNGALDAANECFCDGECVAGGVANVSACRYGAPAFVSFPHFHLADPAYRAAVRGMRPSADRHSFFIALEPTYGIPLDVAARFQINLMVRRDPDIYMLAKVPQRLMFPVIWFEQRAAITPELAVPLRLLLLLPAMLLGTAGALAVAGLGCLAGALLLRAQRRRRRTDTLALVASIVGRGASRTGCVQPTTKPPLCGSRGLLASGATGPGGANQPLLTASDEPGSGGTSSPVRTAPAPAAAEDSGTPEPGDPDEEPPARGGTGTRRSDDEEEAVRKGSKEEEEEEAASRVAEMEQGDELGGRHAHVRRGSSAAPLERSGEQDIVSQAPAAPTTVIVAPVTVNADTSPGPG
ncbi:protein peste-like isoform X1 [Frankliniella occidentalis]|uniref:Protein peste-like isoform X1 n=2 Tax=Frankliniella occidentalis TaxID=133901 RepID=A0A9C6U3G9_FRAOC|nr:protein peste-like isoform X1 [Frankliniella occidentalis]